MRSVVNEKPVTAKVPWAYQCEDGTETPSIDTSIWTCKLCGVPHDQHKRVRTDDE